MAGSDTSDSTLREILEDYARTLAEKPGLSGSEILNKGRELLAWKKARNRGGIFSTPPSLMTATLDDGIGQGLTLIHCFAELAGLQPLSLGLMQTPETIVAECRRREPDLLGLTVLHFDTEEILCNDIIPRLPHSVRVITGGPVFAAISEEELSEKPYRVLNTVSAFVNYLLEISDTNPVES